MEHLLLFILFLLVFHTRFLYIHKFLIVRCNNILFLVAPHLHQHFYIITPKIKHQQFLRCTFITTNTVIMRFHMSIKIIRARISLHTNTTTVRFIIRMGRHVLF